MVWPFPWCFFRSGVPLLLARKIIPTHEISQSLPAKRSGHIDINTCNSKVMPLLCLASIPATNVQFHAGDTRLHHDEWRLLTSDRFILQTVAGATLEFDSNPVQLSQPRTIHFSDYEFHGIDNEITNFLKSGIIESATLCNGEFVSNIFARDKKDGSLRVILNLIDLNQFITYHHFKMDTIDTVINLMITNCFMASIDLSNAYFSIPVLHSHRRFLRFKCATAYFNLPFYQTDCLVLPECSLKC